MRVDFQTILISPSAREGYVRADIFLGLRISGEFSPENPFSILVPVDGIPLSVKTQAMTLGEFDRAYTHAENKELAFYRQVAAENAGQTCIYASIAATAGPPAWFLLAPYWPPKGPPLTAVITEPHAAENQYHSVKNVRITNKENVLRNRTYSRSFPPLRALRTSQSDYLIEVKFTPIRTSESDMKNHATTGLRISYEAPLQEYADSWHMRLPLLDTQSAPPVALTRVYVNMPANWNVQLDIPKGRNTFTSPQGLVNDVLETFGHSDTSSESKPHKPTATSVISTRTAHGGKTLRVVASFAHSNMSLSLRMNRCAAGPARSAATALGAVMLNLFWPFALTLYIVGIWATIRTYFWMVSLRHPRISIRSMAILAGLFPIITPWFALLFVKPEGKLPHDGDETGALGSVPIQHYDYVARLVLWATLVCVNWALLEGMLKLALRLRFE